MSQFTHRSGYSGHSYNSTVSEASLLNEDFVEVDEEYFGVGSGICDESGEDGSSSDEEDGIELTPEELEGEVPLMNVSRSFSAK